MRLAAPGNLLYMDGVSLGSLITSVRKTRSLTQHELGAQLDPPRSAPTVAKWENNQRAPDSDQLRDICRVLHVSADVLLERVPFQLGPMPDEEP